MPKTEVQWLSAAAAALGLLAGLLVAAGVGRDLLCVPSGVAIGLWLAAAFVWIRDPETTLL